MAAKRKNRGGRRRTAASKRIGAALKKYVRSQKRKTNAPRSRSVSLKGFTGTIRQLANGGLTIKGRGKKK